MRDNGLRTIAVLVIIIAFFVLGVAFSVFTFQSTTEVSIEEKKMELIGEYTSGFLVLYKLHDNRDNVTCWVYRGGQGGGISCIPDHLLSP